MEVLARTTSQPPESQTRKYSNRMLHFNLARRSRVDFVEQDTLLKQNLIDGVIVCSERRPFFEDTVMRTEGNCLKWHKK